MLIFNSCRKEQNFNMKFINRKHGDSKQQRSATSTLLTSFAASVHVRAFFFLTCLSFESSICIVPGIQITIRIAYILAKANIQEKGLKLS